MGKFFAITTHPPQDRPRRIKGHVSKVQGRAVKATPHSHFTAQIKSVVKEQLGVEVTRENLILKAFKGQDSLPTDPVRTEHFLSRIPSTYVGVAPAAHESTEDRVCLQEI
jgi:hypothetical protein